MIMRRGIGLSIVPFLLLVACSGGGGPDTPPAATDYETTARDTFRRMLQTPADPDPALASFVDLAVASYASSEDLQATYASLRQAYLAAVQDAGDAVAAQQAALSGGNVFSIEPAAAASAAASHALGAEVAVVYFVNGIRTNQASAGTTAGLLRQYVHAAAPDLTGVDFRCYYNRSGVNPGSVSDAVCKQVLGNLTPIVQLCSPSALGGVFCTPAIYRLVAEILRLQQLCLQVGGSTVDLLQAFAQWLAEINASLAPTAAFAAQTLELAGLVAADVAAGKRVVLVAHSQGNFFTKQALALLPADTRAEVGVVSVASPVMFSSSAGYAHLGYHMLENDAIRCIPTAPPPNRSNPLSDETGENLCFGGCCWGGVAVHDFAISYLGHPESRDPIVADILAAIGESAIGLQAIALPSLFTGPNDQARLVDAVQTDVGGRVAVCWKTNAATLDCRFLTSGGQWSALQSVPFTGSSMSPWVPDPGGDVLALTAFDYVRFGPNTAVTASTTALGFYYGAGALVRTTQPLRVAGGTVYPGMLVGAAYDSDQDTWNLQQNATGGGIDLDGLVLPYDGTAFQVLRVATTPSLDYELRTEYRQADGVLLGGEVLTTSSAALSIIASAYRSTGRALVIVGKEAGGAVELIAFHQGPGGGWSVPDAIGSPDISLQTALVWHAAAIGSDGAAVLALGGTSSTDGMLFTREANGGAWQSAPVPGLAKPTGAAVSPEGGFLVAGISDAQALRVAGKRPGLGGQWRLNQTTTLDNALPLGFLASARVQPAAGTRFLLVADLVLFPSFTREIAAALVEF